MIDIATIEATNRVLAYFGVFAILASVFLLVDMQGKRMLAPVLERWGNGLACLITLGATAMTLVYSEVFGLIPCGLCWFERMLLFPQVIIMGGALFVKDNILAPLYGIMLSAFGLVIALYHHYLQMGGNEFIKCPAAGEGVSCAKRFMFEFGFITFPLMAAILFAFLIVFYIYLRRVTN